MEIKCLRVEIEEGICLVRLLCDKFLYIGFKISVE